MKPFHTIAIPHKDILEGRLTMDVFAADLWEVFQHRGPDEYQDADTFFRKTYLTQGLEELFGVVGKRLRGEGGDPVIQIQTPFGGGKTHALIALHHKAAEWDTKPVVIVGTAMGTDQTLWGVMEKQLTGEIASLAGQVAPGREAIRELLYDHQPVLILMDEVLEYATKAAGVKVEESTLAGQSIAFMQELTEVAGTLEKVCLLVSLPSSVIEHYDEGGKGSSSNYRRCLGESRRSTRQSRTMRSARSSGGGFLTPLTKREQEPSCSGFWNMQYRRGFCLQGWNPASTETDSLTHILLCPKWWMCSISAGELFQRSRGREGC